MRLSIVSVLLVRVLACCGVFVCEYCVAVSDEPFVQLTIGFMCALRALWKEGKEKKILNKNDSQRSKRRSQDM